MCSSSSPPPTPAATAVTRPARIDRAVGLVEERADRRTTVRAGRGRPPRSASPARRRRSRSPGGRWWPAGRPQRGLLDLAVVADPLGLDAVGAPGRGGMPGATLTQRRRRRQQVDSTNDHGGVQSSTSKARPRPVRRAGSAKATSKPAGVDAWSRRRPATAPAQAEGGEVGLGDGDPHRVEVDAGGDEPGAGEGDQVAADAAAEVDRRVDGVERRAAGRPGASATREPGGLLEPVGGEVHPARRASPNFATGPRAQLRPG